MTASWTEERQALLALSRLCEPGSWGVHSAVQQHGAPAVYAALRAGSRLPPISARAAAGAHGRAVGYDLQAEVERVERCGSRLVTPVDDEWPHARLDWDRTTRLAPPLGLFVRGEGQLADSVERSVAVVGARAATVYGAHLAGELGLGIADRGWVVVSGGAYGVDGAAHRGALASTRATTSAVLACSVDIAYPAGHTSLLAQIARSGLLISEHPPGSAPTRSRFLVRNRLIAALTVGTVVVEAAPRSGSLTTARQAAELGRDVMAVPGPVTSALSAGCHGLLRSGAVCVTSAAEVLDAVGALTGDASPEPSGPAGPRDGWPELTRRVLDAVPVRHWAGPASIARAAGVAVTAVHQVLPPLQVAGLVEESLDGWRLTALGLGVSVGAAS